MVQSSEVSICRQPLVLELQRTIPASRGAVWRCWTEPQLLKQWYSPKPWRVSKAEFDLRPGGRMTVEMQGPDGESSDASCTWLEIVPGERLVFSDSYDPGFVPRNDSFMTGYVSLEDAEGGGTKLIWGARHTTEEQATQHFEMGFEEGWTTASNQLSDLARSLDQFDGPASTVEMGRPKVRTCLWFDGNGHEAAEFYVSLLPGSYLEGEFDRESGEAPLVLEFTLGGAPYMILNGGPHYELTPAASISVLTKDQAETDALWTALLKNGGEESMCGWLTDRFGLSWQIVPETLPGLLNHPDTEAAARVRQALMKMRKIEIGELVAAFGAA